MCFGLVLRHFSFSYPVVVSSTVYIVDVDFSQCFKIDYLPNKLFFLISKTVRAPPNGGSHVNIKKNIDIKMGEYLQKLRIFTKVSHLSKDFSTF